MKTKNIIIQFWSIHGSDSIFSLYVVLNVSIYHEKKFAFVEMRRSEDVDLLHWTLSNIVHQQFQIPIKFFVNSISTGYISNKWIG